MSQKEHQINPRTTEAMDWTSVLLCVRREGGMTKQHGVLRPTATAMFLANLLGEGEGGGGGIAFLITPGLEKGSGQAINW